MFIPEQFEPLLFEVCHEQCVWCSCFIIVQAIEAVLKDKAYDDKLVQGWY